MVVEILVAEDELVAAELLSGVLEELGHQVTVVGDGQEALEHLLTGTCNVVISDWNMPRMDGPQLCRAIRSANLGRYIYIILLTIHDGTRHIVDGLSAGADEFMSKPFVPEELSVRLRTAKRILSLESRDMTIFAMARLAESRDPETGLHLERVRGYSCTLAKELASRDKYQVTITPSFITMLYQTSPLHDIGKVGIPDYILLKPDRLDEEEFEIMKTHTRIGAETLESVLMNHPGAEFLRMARDIAGYHHERFDGKGYPSNLAGDDIPLAARIFSVADVYDALVSRRIYKAAFTHDVALNIILKGSGTQFDPDVVESFTRLQDEFERISSKYSKPL
jgi:putative two-component system response regulator